MSITVVKVARKNFKRKKHFFFDHDTLYIQTNKSEIYTSCQDKIFIEVVEQSELNIDCVKDKNSKPKKKKT